MELAKVGTNAFAALGVGAVLAIILPITIALIWKFKKKERFTTILIGVAAFVLFAMIIEKLIQNVLIFPTQMMLPDHAVSRFINARPLLWALVVALFPGVFEETGRLIAFKTVLRKRKNRETSISYGIGHGCGEAMILLGITYIEYIVFAVMINLGTFQTVIDQAAAQAPDQINTVYALAGQIASFSMASLGVALFERVFAVLFHIGASILVFYACKDKKKIWLYPFAIILHTAMDFIAALTLTGIWTPSTWLLEAIVAVFGILVFCGAYFLLYRKDKG
ncbi:MAG: YhfC family intramembrane metalloprotease [Lachnospiraceae bacterium]|nr:YhfC family intramembrane metalloprotease [Lachnospiraceae bacterium]